MYRYGKRSVRLPSRTSMKPSYDPGAGRAPCNRAVNDPPLTVDTTGTSPFAGVLRGTTVAVYEAPAGPLIVTVRVSEIVVGVSSPNEIVAGETVNVALTASPMFRRPAPTDRTLAVAPRSVTSWL